MIPGAPTTGLLNAHVDGKAVGKICALCAEGNKQASLLSATPI